ncbi:hypothetical protein INT45_006975, partial [Circinella minor]
DEEEEEEDVNEKHAKYKVELSELEDKISSSGKSKKKKNKVQEENVNSKEIHTKIDKLRQALRNLEADWDFDKRRAQALYIEEQKNANETRRLKNERLRQQQREEEMARKAAEEEEKKGDDDSFGFGLGLGDDDEGDEEGGLFGGLLNEEEGSSTIPASTTVTYNIIDTTTTAGWKGRYPKDMLDEYCKRNGGLKVSYTKNEISKTCWRAVVKITYPQKHEETKNYELPTDLAAGTKEGAEQLVATRCLFELDANSAVYKIMPVVFKDLWLEWLDEKVRKYIKKIRVI